MSELISIDPLQPVRLSPVFIPKPWGQEIWFTGMEERGVSEVQIGERSLPLDKYLAHDPSALADNETVLLLKILDPKPNEVVGDLYFEVHEEKQEVYVVTAVDPAAWPDGTGAIRLGMNQTKRSEYADDASFRQAYLKAVTAYESVRRSIDDGTASTTAQNQEPTLRANMESFTSTRSLCVGDVVKVPVWTPHALQHGVRVVEFQTATYERYIISFAQKVLTQNHWDSATAIERMHLDAPSPAEFETIGPGIERIVEFGDFNVWRAENADQVTLPTHIPYAVCMALKDGVHIGELTLSAEEACFIPAALIKAECVIHCSKTALLVAAPGL